jgi:inner membrane protein YidH
MPEKPLGSPSDYLAAERTFLAWIRTGLALMGFGFVVARFGLFLEALHLGPSNLQVRAYGPSFWFGTALIVLGVAVDIVSARNHVRLIRALNHGAPGYNRPSRLALGVAFILAAVGLAMAIYVISVREPDQDAPKNIGRTQ